MSNQKVLNKQLFGLKINSARLFLKLMNRIENTEFRKKQEEQQERRSHRRTGSSSRSRRHRRRD